MKAYITKGTATKSTQFKFTLKAKNGKIIAHGEHYNRKRDLLDTLEKYFAGFEIIDQTK